MPKTYFVYILSNKKNGTLYIGVTSHLAAWIFTHKEKLNDGFTKKYDIMKLVYYEMFSNPVSAIEREKLLKEWNRDWKIKLIEKIILNGGIYLPNWDLANCIVFSSGFSLRGRRPGQTSPDKSGQAGE